MASADFSRFVVTACPCGLALETSPVMDVFFPPYTRLIYFESSEQLWDFVLFCRLIHSLKPSYQVSVRQVRCLPTASFRFHLTMDTFSFGCSLPTVRATWGLAPVRIRSCWANKESTLQINDLEGVLSTQTRYPSSDPRCSATPPGSPRASPKPTSGRTHVSESPQSQSAGRYKSSRLL